MKRIQFILFTNCLLALFGCDQEVFLDIQESDVKPVVNCVFTPDSIFKVYLNKSNSRDIISNATINLYHDNEMVGTVDYCDSFLYKSTELVLSEGLEYSIIIKVPGFPDVRAWDTVPKVTPILNLNYFDSSGVKSSGLIYSSFEIGFSDPPDEKNYYEIYIIREADTTNLLLWDSTDTDIILNNGISLWQSEKVAVICLFGEGRTIKI